MSGVSISKDQKYLLVKLVSNDQELLRAKFTATTKGSQRRWSAIAEQVNDIPGKSMEWKQWRLIWQDLHSAARKAAITKHSKGTCCESPTCCLNQVTIPAELISATIVPSVSTNLANVPTIITIGSALSTIESIIPTIKSTIPNIVPTDQTIEPIASTTEAAILTTVLSDPTIESTIPIGVLTDPTIEPTIPTNEATIPSVETGLPTDEATIPTAETALPTVEVTIPAIILTESTPAKPKHRASRWRPINPSEIASASDILAAKAKAEMKQQYYNMKLEYKRQQLDRLHRMTIAIEMLAATLTPVPN